MTNEKGFCSIAIIIITSIATLLGSFFILFAKNEMAATESFYDGIAAENLAQAGICDVLVKLRKNSTIVEEMFKQAKDEVVLVSDAYIKKGKYTVYLTYRNGQPLVLSTGEYNKAKRQVIAALRLGKDKGLSVEYWSNE